MYLPPLLRKRRFLLWAESLLLPRCCGEHCSCFFRCFCAAGKRSAFTAGKHPRFRSAGFCSRGDPYPGLYVSKPDYVPHEAGDKVVYLTFDDGPSNLTIPVLDVLDRYGIKATFFVVGKTSEEDKEALRQTVDRGHTLAVHTYTHQYEEIYASPEAIFPIFPVCAI